MNDFNVEKLDDDNKKAIEGLITLEASTETLKSMKNEKSSGPSGFPVIRAVLYENEMILVIKFKLCR